MAEWLANDETEMKQSSPNQGNDSLLAKRDFYKPRDMSASMCPGLE
jgi:hypothetical protein